MAFRVCRGCGCRYAAAAPCCPDCRETAHDVIEEEAAMAKILPDGTVTYEPGHEPGSGEEHVHPAASPAQDVPELEEESAESASPAPVPAPVGGEPPTVPPPADPAAKAAPKTPPRRGAPPRSGGDA
jgi:hypothetical protein